jgi:hypothetical protein
MNHNSALIWLPRIIEAALPTPRTMIVRYTHGDLVNVFDGENPPEYIKLCDAVKTACKTIGYPVFIRTDLSSAKHDGPTAYRIDGDKDILRCVYATLEDNEMKFWLESEGPKAILVREWLDLESPFSAFNHHPISREWRFFANAEKVICFHPYWPESSIQFYAGMKEPDDWRGALKILHKVPDNVEELKAMAAKAAGLYGVVASIDFARDKGGKWWLTDMAMAEGSFHWEECENRAMQMRRFYLPQQS